MNYLVGNEGIMKNVKPSVNRFLAENKLNTQEVQYVVSKNFVDENGVPIEWSLRPVSAGLNQKIREDKDVLVTTRDRKTGSVDRYLNDTQYMAKLAAFGVTYPDLTDKELQASYTEVLGRPINDRTELLKAMLSAGELANLALKVIEISGFDVDEDDNIPSNEELEVLEAKN